MSRFDRCETRVSRTSGTGIAGLRPCIRVSAVVGLMALTACTAPSDRLQGDPDPTESPAQSATEMGPVADDPLASGGGQVSRVPSELDFAGIAAGIRTPPIYGGGDTPVGDADAPTSPPDPDASTTTASSGQDETSDPTSVEVAIVEGGAQVAPDLQRIQAMLRRLADEADDPIPYHLAASILPVIGMKGSADAEPDPFVVPEAELDGEEAAMLGEVAAFATGLRTRIDAGEPTRAVLVEELEGLLERLERGSRLTIAVAELCREVRGAGDYELLPRVFASGRPQEVLIYVDLDGEEWTEIDGGEWEWAVDWKLELHQVSDRSIADQTDWNRQQTRRAYPVDDNYLLIRYTIPAEDLASALYVLKVRFREPGTKRETETAIQFQLVPRRAIAVQGT